MGCTHVHGSVQENGLKANTTLRMLSVANNWLGWDGVASLLCGVRSSPSLTELDLSNCRASCDRGALVLCAAIEAQTKDTPPMDQQSMPDGDPDGDRGQGPGADGSADTDGAHAGATTPAGGRCWAELASLSLSELGLASANMVQLLRSFKTNRVITSLDISKNPIDGDGIDALCELVSSPDSALVALDLSCCALGARGVRRLMAALAANTKLTRLKLAANALAGGAQCAIELFDVTAGAPLQLVDLSENGVPESIRAAICAAAEAAACRVLT